MTKGNVTLRTLPLIALVAVAMAFGTERAAFAQYYAFQDSSHQLRIYNSQDQTVTINGPAMKSGTVPSQVIVVNGKYYVAYQGSNGHLWIDSYDSSFNDSGVAMAPGTSPSYTILPGPHGAYTSFAFQGSNGHLWVSLQGSIYGARDANWLMASGTSPSIAGLPGENYQLAIAFQNSNGQLVVSMTGTTGFEDTGNQMAGGTSPSIAAPPTPQGEIAFSFQGSNDQAWFGVGDGFGGTQTFQGIQSGTSPSLGVDPNDSTAVVATTDGNVLEIYVNDPSYSYVVGYSDAHNAASTASPTVIYVDVNSGYYEVAYKGTNGHLWLDETYMGYLPQDNGPTTLTDSGIAMN